MNKIKSSYVFIFYRNVMWLLVRGANVFNRKGGRGRGGKGRKGKGRKGRKGKERKGNHIRLLVQ